MASFRRKHFHKRPERKDADEAAADEAPPALVPMAPSVRASTGAAAAAAAPTAAEVLKESLRQRLRARIRVKNTLRQGGTSQEVQGILEKFNDGDEEKASMMQDIQKDVKGMRTKDAKKYLNKVLGTMGQKDTDTFVDMVKDKVPGHQSQQLMNYVKRNQKTASAAAAAEAEAKPQVNPDTVYVPTRLLSDEAKRERRTAQTKKPFGRVNIHVPKLTELRDHPTVAGPPPAPVSSAKKTKKPPAAVPSARVVDGSVAPLAPALAPVPGVPLPPRRGTASRAARQADIDRLFPAAPASTSHEEKEAARLTLFQRIKNVKAFDPDRMADSWRQFLFDASDVVEVLWIRDLEFLPVPAVMAVPDSEELVVYADLPGPARDALATGTLWSDPASPGWLYQRSAAPLADGSPAIRRLRNAAAECAEFLGRFDRVKTWLATLKGQRVPWQWLCEVLNDLGVLRQRTEGTAPKGPYWTELFRVLCHEYRNDRQKLTVPIVPFVKLTMALD